MISLRWCLRVMLQLWNLTFFLFQRSLRSFTKFFWNIFLPILTRFSTHSEIRSRSTTLVEVVERREVGFSFQTIWSNLTWQRLVGKKAIIYNIYFLRSTVESRCLYLQVNEDCSIGSYRYGFESFSRL